MAASSDALADEPSARARARADVSVAELRRAIEPHVKTARNIHYHVDMSADMDRAKLVANGALLAGLHSLSAGLALRRSTVEVAFRQILEAKIRSGWMLDDDEKAQWPSVMSKRVMCMTRHLRQAMLKGLPTWLRLIPLEESQPPSVQTLASSSTPKRAVEDWFFGYSEEHAKAWRAPASSPSGQRHKELRLEMQIPPGGRADHDVEMLALWPDGMQRPVPECTVGMFLAGHDDGGDVGWKATMPNGNLLRVRQEPDRLPIMALFEQGKRVLIAQIDLHFNGDVAEAERFMIQVAEIYLNGDITVEQLRKKRTELLNEWKGQREAPRLARKRLASAMSADLPAPARAPAKKPASNVGALAVAGDKGGNADDDVDSDEGGAHDGELADDSGDEQPEPFDSDQPRNKGDDADDETETAAEGEDAPAESTRRALKRPAAAGMPDIPLSLCEMLELLD